nr:MAG TPA: hypothetical protein [Caudoviricetes sp.]
MLRQRTHNSQAPCIAHLSDIAIAAPCACVQLVREDIIN